MRAHRTRMLAAVLGTAVLVTGLAPAAVLAGKPADHSNPHATAPAPEPSADPSVDPVEPTPEPTIAPTEAPSTEPTAAPTEVPAVTPEPTEAPAGTPEPTESPVTSDAPDADPRVAAEGSIDAEVVPAVVEGVQLVVTPGTIAPGDTVTLTATITPVPILGCGHVTFLYNGTTGDTVAYDAFGVAVTTVTAVAGLHDATANFSGCVGSLPSSDTAPVDARVSPGPVTLEIDRSTAIQHEEPVTLTAHLSVDDATGTVTFARDVSGTPQALETVTVNGVTSWIITTTLPVGTYDIYATYGGDSLYLPSDHSNTVSITITADSSVKTTGLAVQYSRFYPRNDGYRDTDRISGTTLEHATVTIRIYTSGGTRIKTFSLGTKHGAYSATWDGRRKDGSLFPQGTYTVKQSFTDLGNNTKTVNQSITLSSKKLYWYTTSQSRYADTGAVAYDGDGGAYHSNTWSHGVILIGGSSGYAAARYTFTLPSATVYSSVRASVYGKSMSGYGKGYIGVRNFSNDNLDAFKYVGYSTDWYGNSVAASGHVTSDRKVQLWAFADSDNFGGVNFLKVKLTYKYAVLKY